MPESKPSLPDAMKPLAMKLHATMMRVKNLDISRDWYETKLEMRVEYQDSPYRMLNMISPSGARIALWELREGEEPTTTAPTTAYVVFLSSDARADHRTLVARGVEATEPQDTGLGLRFFWITDPDQHRICVIEFLPE